MYCGILIVCILIIVFLRLSESDSPGCIVAGSAVFFTDIKCPYKRGLIVRLA